MTANVHCERSICEEEVVHHKKACMKTNMSDYLMRKDTGKYKMDYIRVARKEKMRPKMIFSKGQCTHIAKRHIFSLLHRKYES